jgi:hypothetical protein
MCSGSEYLRILRNNLTGFLENLSRSPGIAGRFTQADPSTLASDKVREG